MRLVHVDCVECSLGLLDEPIWRKQQTINRTIEWRPVFSALVRTLRWLLSGRCL